MVNTKGRRRVTSGSSGYGNADEVGSVHVFKTKTEEVVSTNMSSLNTISNQILELTLQHIQEHNDKADAVDSKARNSKN